MVSMVKDKVTEKAIEKAADAIDALAERAKDALYGMARQAEQLEAGDMRDSAWRMAERARAQAGDLFSRGQRTASAVRSQVEEQPWIAIAVVGAFALVLGYALKSR